MSAAAAAAEQGVEHQASDALEALMATWLGEEKALPNGASELELKASIKLLQAQRAAAVGKAELARIDGELGARFEQLRARRGLQLLESGRIWECIGTKVRRDEGERGGRGGNEGRASHAGGDDSGEGEGEGAGVGGGEAIVEGEGGRGRGSGNGHSDGRRAWAVRARRSRTLSRSAAASVCACRCSHRRFRWRLVAVR